MKKLVLFIFLTIISCYCASALPSITISPQHPLVDILQGNTGTFSINITNTGDTDLYNLSFTPITAFNFPQNLFIAKNTSIITNYSVYGQTGISNPSSTVSFYYNVITPVTPMTHTITINSAGFSTQNKTIYSGDTISFKNTDTINHTITLTDLSYDKILLPDEDINISFNSVGVKTYYDKVTSLGMYINIFNNIVSTSAHDSSLDKTMSFTYNLLYNKALLSVESILPTSYSMDYKSTTEGVIQLKVNDTAYHVRLYDEWFNFEEQDFTMQKDTTKIIKYKVTPHIDKYTNQTNMTHTRIIRITSTNADNVNQSVPIFINYYNFDLLSANGTAIYTNYIVVNWTEAVEFCSKNPDQYFCNGFPTITKEVPAQVKFNLSETDFMNYLQSVKDNSDRMQRIENNMIEDNNNQNTRFTNEDNEDAITNGRIDNLSNNVQLLIDRQSKFEQEENEEDSFIYYLFGLLIVTIISLVIGFYTYQKIINDKRIFYK